MRDTLTRSLSDSPLFPCMLIYSPALIKEMIKNMRIGYEFTAFDKNREGLLMVSKLLSMKQEV